MTVSHSYSKPAAARRRYYDPSIPQDFINSVQAALRAKAVGLKYRHQYTKTAEAILIQELPEFSKQIRTVGSRKGESGKIGAQVASGLGGPAAAALAVLWAIRNARRPGIRAVVRVAAQKPGFASTMGRLIGQTETKRLMGGVGRARFSASVPLRRKAANSREGVLGV